MRILFLNQAFYPDPAATSQYLGDLAVALAEQGHEVTVLCSRRGYVDPAQHYPAQETWRGVRIIRVQQTGLGKKAKWRRALDFFTFLLSATGRAFFSPRADVVVALTSPPIISALGALLTLVRGGRFFYWVMDLNPDEAVAAGWLASGSLTARGLEMISRWSLLRADRVVVLDDAMRERVLAKGLSAEKVEVVPLWPQAGVAFTPEGREQFRRQQGWENAFVVMYAGNHSPCHPLDPLLEVAQRLAEEPRLRFCFVGGGSEWSRLRLRAGQLGLRNVEFLGYQPFAELGALLSAADLQVVVMGAPFVGLIHPCKIYNLLAVGRPVLSLGPERSHVTTLLAQAGVDLKRHAFLPENVEGISAELQRRLISPFTRGETPAVLSLAGLETWLGFFAER